MTAKFRVVDLSQTSGQVITDKNKVVTIADPDLETVDTEVGGAENKVGMNVTGILPIVTEAEVIERSEKPDETDAEVTDGPLELRRK